ncbi:MAG: DUF2461 domain-containing protein [Polyangiaceae bacterium]|jgi:uncharacterized protein (TIGR02453 family)
MGRFEGFADAEGKFFKSLAKNQKREWFLAHKGEFEEGWNQPMKDLLADLRAAIDRSYAHCDLGEPKVFRIFRDVRFSKDKSPYKTFVAGCIPTKGSAKVTETPAVIYMHFGTQNVIASGLYMMDAPVLARYRSAVADDTRGKELVKIIAKLEKDGFIADSLHDDVLKKVPRGFDPEHPRGELLRRKSLGVSFPAIPKGMLASPKLLPWLVDYAKKVVPLVEWLVYATA